MTGIKFSVFAASIALIILVDIATGQGPPALNGYMSPAHYRQPSPLGPSPQLPPMPGYVSRGGDYDEKDKSGAKTIGSEKEGRGKVSSLDKESYDKEYEKDYRGSGKDYKSSSNTPAPGVWGSFSNSMSDAWKSLTSLGRQTRSVEVSEETEKQSEHKQSEHKQSEHKQSKHQEYVYFKVPKSLVCSYN